MARLPRLSLAGLPHHIIQRGNNRQPVFLSPVDQQFFLDVLHDNARRSGVALHAYVLMPNHFHLLLTPDTDEALPQMMQSLGRSYVRYFNDRHGRSGTLWEGRYRSTLIQPERHLLACMAYIDLNPVRDGLVAEAREYPWSSHGHYAGLRAERLVTPHPLYWSLGNTPFAREAAYAEMVRGGLPASQQLALTDATLSGWALGDEKFVADLQKKTLRRVARTRAGRPPANAQQKTGPGNALN